MRRWRLEDAVWRDMGAILEVCARWKLGMRYGRGTVFGEGSLLCSRDCVGNEDRVKHFGRMYFA